MTRRRATDDEFSILLMAKTWALERPMAQTREQLACQWCSVALVRRRQLTGRGGGADFGASSLGGAMIVGHHKLVVQAAQMNGISLTPGGPSSIRKFDVCKTLTRTQRPVWCNAGKPACTTYGRTSA